jgi:hypothetical protein
MTGRQLKDLAAAYLRLAEELREYRTTSPPLTDADRDRFNKLLGDVIRTAENLMNQALEQDVFDVEAPAATVRNATELAVSAVRTVGTIGKVLSIGSAAVGLGAALLHPPPNGVSDAVNTLVHATQKSAAQKTGGS